MNAREIVIRYEGVGVSGQIRLHELAAVPELREEAARACDVLADLYGVVSEYALRVAESSEPARPALAVVNEPEPEPEPEPPSEPAPEPAPAPEVELAKAKPYVCPDCRGRFARSQALASHRATQHAEPVSCPDCGRRCSSPRALTLHRTTHRGAGRPAPQSRDVQADVDAAQRPEPSLCDCGHAQRVHEDSDGPCRVCDCGGLRLVGDRA